MNAVQPYRPDGEGRFRDAMLKALDAVRPDQRIGLALYYMVSGMDTLAANAPGSAQKRIASAYADMGRDFIPADILDLVARARKVNSDGGEGL